MSIASWEPSQSISGGLKAPGHPAGSFLFSTSPASPSPLSPPRRCPPWSPTPRSPPRSRNRDFVFVDLLEVGKIQQQRFFEVGEGRWIVLCLGKEKLQTELKSYKKSLVKLKYTGLLVLRNSILLWKRFEPESCHTGGCKNSVCVTNFL